MTIFKITNLVAGNCQYWIIIKTAWLYLDLLIIFIVKICASYFKHRLKIMQTKNPASLHLPMHVKNTCICDWNVQKNCSERNSNKKYESLLYLQNISILHKNNARKRRSCWPTPQLTPRYFTHFLPLTEIILCSS